MEYPVTQPNIYPTAQPSNIGGFVLDEVGVLASVAYGLRKLIAGYNGPLCRVRRNADSVERDFFASGESISISELLAFSKGDSCFIPAWYDQSGNIFHVTQTATSKQPRIVNSGVVEIDASGKPTLYFDGSDDVLSNSSVSISNLCNTFIVAKSNAVDNEARIACSLTDETGDTNNFRLLGYNPVTPRLSFCQRANEVQLVTSDTSISGSVIAAAKRSATNYQESYVNGVSKGTNTNVTTTYAASRINIGNTRATSAYPNTGAWNGNISEVIITTPLSDSQRQKLERNQGKYYGINVA